MALGNDDVVVRTTAEQFVLKVEPNGRPPSGSELRDALWAARELRFGLESQEPDVRRAATTVLRLIDGGSFAFAASSERARGAAATAERLATRLFEELVAGRLVVQRSRIAPLTDRRDITLPELPPLPPAARESSTHTFEVRFVDEVGRGIAGIDAEFTTDQVQTRATNAAGIALLDGVLFSSASVAIVDPEALSKVLDPRWESRRPGSPPKESNTTTVVFRKESLGPFGLKAELPNTVVVRPPLAKLALRLFDKTGRVPHAARSVVIEGPEKREGITDDDGSIRFDEVMQGDYKLTLTIESFKGDPDETVEVAEAAVVALDPDEPQAQLRMLGAVPLSFLARLHLAFNTNKAFLLPSALTSMQKLRRLYVENAPCKLLVVGHADTRGGSAFNDKLSLQRAQATIAYLNDDVEAWLAFYDLTDERRVWGKVEDRLMLTAMPDFRTKPAKEDAVSWFQRTRGLKVDGKAGKQTRSALIGEYMSLDGASLSDFVGEIDAVAHGAGEHFPLDDTTLSLDEAPEDEKRDPADRRVDLFFFDREFGIAPPPPGPNSGAGSTQYPKWRERVASVIDLRANDPDAPLVTFVEVTDAHFRTNSAVLLPEGEDPEADGDHQALTSVGLIASALRFNDEHAGRSMLVAGHTDTTADVAFNQKLSQERAEVALALLKGGDTSRERFKSLCDGRHTVADVNQILSWVAVGLDGFDCDPGVVDDSPKPAAVRKFQTAYNQQKATLNPDPKVATLNVDGSFGKLTWGAVFDCYEAALRDELGEDASGLAALRTKLRFVNSKREFLGFSEHFPIEELGVDNFRSQSNRRVELLFFEAGEEPDLEHAAQDPETTELYLPGQYERMPLPPMGSARRRQLVVNVVDHLGFPVTNQEVTLFLPDQSTLKVATDDAGTLTAQVPFGVVAMLLRDGRFLHFGGKYADYKHDPVTEIEEFPTDSDGALQGTGTQEMTIEDLNDSMALLSALDAELALLP